MYRTAMIMLISLGSVFTCFDDTLNPESSQAQAVMERCLSIYKL